MIDKILKNDKDNNRLKVNFHANRG